MSESRAAGEPPARMTGPALVLARGTLLLGEFALVAARPEIEAKLNASPEESIWIVSTYMVVLAAVLLTAGPLADRYGGKRMLVLGLAIEALGASLAAQALATGQLIATRALMGVGAALILTGAQRLIRVLWPDSRTRGRVLAKWSAAGGPALVLGFAGVGWRVAGDAPQSILIVPALIYVVVLMFVARLPESRGRYPRSLDIGGCLLSAVAMFSMVWCLIEARMHGLDTVDVWGPAVAATAAAAAWLVWELRHPSPMVDLRLFARTAFATATGGLGLAAVGIFGGLNCVTRYLVAVRELAPANVAMWMLPAACGLVTGAPVAARLADRIGTRAVACLGLGVLAFGMGTLSQVGRQGAYCVFGAGLLLAGLGTGAALSQTLNTALDHVTEELAGSAAAIGYSIRYLGYAVGVAVCGSLAGSSDSRGEAHTSAAFAAGLGPALFFCALMAAFGAATVALGSLARPAACPSR